MTHELCDPSDVAGILQLSVVEPMWIGGMDEGLGLTMHGAPVRPL